MDLVKEMLPPEQAAMFDTYSTLFQNMDLGSFGSGDFSTNDFGAGDFGSCSSGPMDFGFFSQ